MAVQKPDLRRKELFIDSSSEQGQYTDVKTVFVHVINQVDKHFLRTAMMQVMNHKQNFFHLGFSEYLFF